MHIPDSMLQNGVCSVTLAVSAVAFIAAAHFARKADDKPSAARFGAVAALIFAAQMMNFPVLAGVSGHLLGGVLAASLLGVPFGVMAVALVVAVQGLLFGDGGVAALGANIFNIAVLGAGAGGMMLAFLRRHGISGLYATALAAWGSVMLAAFAASAEIAMSGSVVWFEVVYAMLAVHAPIGVGEALLTVSACALFAARRAMLSFAGALVLALFSPYASALPDGLEWVASQQGLLQEAAAHPLAQLWTSLGTSLGIFLGISSAAAGLAGVLLTFVLAWALSRSAGWVTVQHK